VASMRGGPTRIAAVLAGLVFVSAYLGACTPASFRPSGDDLAQGRFAPARASAADSLIVVSYNIQYGEHLEQAEQDLRGDSTTRRADFLLLQEMDPEGVRRLAEGLHYDFVYFPASIHPKHHRLFGNAILSRWPLVEPELVLLPHHGPFAGTQRVLTAAVALVASDTVLVASVHTSTVVTPHDQRISQIETIIEHLRRSRWRVIVGGDFNTALDNDVATLRDRFRRAGFRPARLPPESTVRKKPGFFFAGRIVLDHIFCRGFQVAGTGIVTNARASDHFPIWAVLRMRPDEGQRSGQGEE